MGRFPAVLPESDGVSCKDTQQQNQSLPSPKPKIGKDVNVLGEQMETNPGKGERWRVTHLTGMAYPWN